MWALAVLLAAAVVAPAGYGFVGPTAPISARPQPTNPGAGLAPLVMPPDPVSGRWPTQAIRPTSTPPVDPGSAFGTVRVLVLLIQFTNITREPSHDAAFFDDYFNNATPAAHSLRAFYRESSYGKLTIDATIVPTWFTSVHPMEYYGKDSATAVDSANGPIYNLVVEAVRAADPTVDFRAFDADGDGVVDHLVVIHAGPGQENHANMTDAIWSHSWAVYDADPSQPGLQSLIVDGVQVFRYTMISESSPLGVMAHEFGHDLGLPDLYDTDGSSDGAGVWDTMALGAWNGAPRGSSPAELSAWSKLRLGWAMATPGPSGFLEDTAIPAVELSPFVLRLSIPGSGSEYFLVENREPISFDVGLPGAGLLIWHVDDSQPDNTNDAHRLLDLEEADEGISGDHPTDAGDPWHDTFAGFGSDTQPGSIAYDGAPTSWRIRDISPAGPTMTATVVSSVAVDMAVQRIVAPAMVARGSAVTAHVIVRNEGEAITTASVAVGVYLENLSPEARVVPETQTTLTFAAETSVTVNVTFNATSLGRYLIDAVASTPEDLIQSDDERVVHVSTNLFAFVDDMESGSGNWTLAGTSQPNSRWEILSASDPTGSAHGGVFSWRFGYVGNNTTSPSSPSWQTLTTSPTNVSGPSFLIFYQRYDFANATDSNSNGTGRATVEVQYGGGGWMQVVAFAGRALSWTGVSVELVPSNVPTTIQVRFNATPGNMPTRGGWWIDDVAIAARGLGRAAVIVPTTLALDAPANDIVPARLKLVNVGDFGDTFVLAGTTPAGWAIVWVSQGEALPAGTTRQVALGPDQDAMVSFVLLVPTSAAGGTYKATVTASAIGSGPIASLSLAVTVPPSGTWVFTAVVASVAAILGIVGPLVLLLRRRGRIPPP